MADSGGTCGYVLDPDDRGTWGGDKGEECAVDDALLNESGVWTCPHAAETDDGLCLFHRPVEEKDDGTVVEAFLNAINGSGMEGSGDSERSHQFLGARFGAFDLGGRGGDLDTDGRTVRMAHTEFTGAVDWSGVELDVASLHLNGCDFTAEVSFEGTTFGGKADFSHTTFERAAEFGLAAFECGADFERARFLGAADFALASFDDDADFSRAVFDGEAGFGGATDVGPGAIGDLFGFDDLEADLGVTFEGTADFDEAEFADDASFKNATFADDAYFRASFDGGARFENAAFGGDAHFSGLADFRATFGGPAEFGRAAFDGDAYLRVEFGDDADFHRAAFGGKADFRATFDGDADFGGATFGAGATFVGTVFRGAADFSDTDAGTGLDFEEATFGRPPSFESANLRGVSFVGSDARGADFRGAHLESADLEGASLRGANFERAKLSNADLFGADLSGVHLYGARIGDAAINTETTLDGHGDHRCVYDPHSEYEYDEYDENVGRLRKAMGAYHVLEELARANTLPDEQSRFFARRQDMRRAQLRQEESFPRLEYWFSEIQNAVFRHGESFTRVIAWAVGTIVVYALVYPAGGWLETTSSTGVGSPVTYARIADEPVLLWKSLYHSAMLFTTGNPYGGVTATNVTAEILQTTEALLGPTLLALVVFVLGRRAAR